MSPHCCLLGYIHVGSGRFKRMLKVEVTQSYPTLFDPMDYTVHGIRQAAQHWSG